MFRYPSAAKKDHHMEYNPLGFSRTTFSAINMLGCSFEHLDMVKVTYDIIRECSSGWRL